MAAAVGHYIAFTGFERLADGPLLTVVRAIRTHMGDHDSVVLIFDAATGRQIDVDLTGTDAEVESRFGSTGRDEAPGTDPVGVSAPRKRGRPRLGVVGREVTLLPRHWQWLDEQRGGASAALRRLVDQARQDNAHEDQVRAAQDRTNRFMGAVAGNLAGFEEAARALYAGDRTRFVEETRRWPGDVRAVVMDFAAPALATD